MNTFVSNDMFFVCFFVLLLNSKFSRIPTDRILSKTMSQVVSEDLEDLGYIFAWKKLDAQSFLLRQRRQRIWGVADLMSSCSQQDFQNRMNKTIESMSTTELLEFEKVFDTNMPKQRISNHLQRKKLEQSLARARVKNATSTGDPNIFMDMSTGRSRDAEYAEDVATCVRPSHNIYSHRLGRSLCAKELWNCQGLFQTAFDNPAAFDDIMKNQAQAQDLAGQGLMRCFSNIYIYIL